MLWWHISALLCLYGFWKEYRPSEPFISSYLVGEWKNFTKEQVNQDIYPVGTYLNLVLLVVVFLLTDFLRYKPVIIVGGLSAVACWSGLRWGTTIPHMQVVEFFYAFFMASEVAYFTYIYAKVDDKHYQKVTSHTRAAFLLGKAGAGLSSQLFVTYNVLDYEDLNYTTIAGVSLATIFGFMLPSVPTSMYFHRDSASDSSNVEYVADGKTDARVSEFESQNRNMGFREKCITAYKYLLKDFVHAFTNPYVVRWSLWWAFATCGYLQVTSYSQLLWEEIKNKDDVLYNGYVEFGYSLIGAFVAFSVGFLKLPWEAVGEIFLAVVSLCQGALLIYSAFADNLLAAYAVYMLFGVLYQSTITIASSEVAKYIREDSYALVFGVNGFVALILQTILTAVIIEAFKAEIRDQFKSYGGYYLVLGVAFALEKTVRYLRGKP